jgi:hypothetical protein
MLLFCVCLSCFCSFAKSDNGAFHFLNIPYSARLASIGGENISIIDDDVNRFYTNPSLLTPNVHTGLSINYLNYFESANSGSISFAYAGDSLNVFGANFIFLGYGKFDGYDEFGSPTGEFSAGDFALNLAYARYLGAGFRVGIAMKPVVSFIEEYKSMALGIDVGANYHNEDIDLTVALAFRNFGFRFLGFYEGQEREALPWNLQVGISKRLKHAPFRFSLTFDRLNDWNLDYHRPTISSPMIGEEIVDGNEIKGGDMFFRHLVLGVDLLFSKNFYLSVAYNHRRNREYSLSNSRAPRGFSFGAGFKVYKFNLDAAYALYGAKGNTFTLSLATALDSFKKKD